MSITHILIQLVIALEQGTDAEGDNTDTLSFTYKGHEIPMEDNAYRCPWCFAIFGNSKTQIKRHLSKSTGICLRDRVDDDSPACSECKSQFSSMYSLSRHIHNYRGSCNKPKLVGNQGKSLFVSVCDIS